MHSIPDSSVRYTEHIDHLKHDVTYVSTPARMATVPANVPARVLERPGTSDTAEEVLAVLTGAPRPDRVIALAEDDILPAAHIREALGVCGPTVADALTARNKVMMKSAVAAAGLRVPRFAPLATVLTHGTQSAGWTGPTVLKPVAGASSEETYRFPSLAAAISAVGSGSVPVAAREFEVEEFVDGRILHVDGLLAAGVPIVIQASRYIGTCLDYAKGSPLGSVQIDTGTALTDWAVRCFTAVGIDTGPFHLEGIETGNALVFLEVAARAGSRGVVDAFELATGIRLTGAGVRLLIEGRDHIPAPRIRRTDERFGWFVFPGHTLGSASCKISGERSFRNDPLVWQWQQRQPGEPVATKVNYTPSVVPVGGLVGPAPAPVLEHFLTRLFQSVRVDPFGPSAAS